jgi:hypothetical protein
MLHATPTTAATRPFRSRAARFETIAAAHGLLGDLLAIAAGVALGILALLLWAVERLLDLDLPAWYWALAFLGMAAATYAQLAQRREQRESDERVRGRR